MEMSWTICFSMLLGVGKGQAEHINVVTGTICLD